LGGEYTGQSREVSYPRATGTNETLGNNEQSFEETRGKHIFAADSPEDF